MLTKACEAEKTNCPHHYLRACQSNIFPYLPRRGESPGSTRTGREREESCLSQTPHWGGSISSPSGWPPSPAIASPRSTSSSRNWASKLETGLGCSELCPGWGRASAVLGMAGGGGKEASMEQMQREAAGGTWVRMGAASPSPARSVPSRVPVAADGCLGHPRGLELPGEGAAAPRMEKPLPKEDAGSSPGNFSSREEGRDSRGAESKRRAPLTFL